MPEESGATAAALADIGQLRLNLEKNKGDGQERNFTYSGATSSRFLSNIQDVQAGDPTDALPVDKGWAKLFPESDEDEIFDTFWNWQKIHFPIVPPDNFLEDYRAGKRNSEFVSPLLLDVIHAFGENFRSRRSKERSAAYFKRAEAGIMVEIGTPRVSTIQGILLLSMFQMGTGNIPVAWIINGGCCVFSTVKSADVEARRHERGAFDEVGAAYRFNWIGRSRGYVASDA